MNEDILAAIGATYLLIMWFLGVNWLFAAATAIHCAHKGPEKGRTAWVLVLFAVPMAGWICYWILTQRQKSHADLSVYRPAPPAPQTKSGTDIASEINATLSEQARQRRQKQ